MVGMLNRKRLSIAIPASVISDVPHLREKTAKIGLIGRAAAIFGVEEIIVYQDLPGVKLKDDADLIATLLRYMETPQYLRKRLFKLRYELRYVGILPPLRTPHHPTAKRVADLKVGEYREGVVISKTKRGVLVDVGVEKPALVPRAHIPVGERVTVKVESVDGQVTAKVVEVEEIPHYWGYEVTVWNGSFGSLAKSRHFDLKIATSKHGDVFTVVKDAIAERWAKARTVLIGFGAPDAGLYEIVKRESLNLDDVVDFVVNTIPGQQTETVRTEEAIIASLAVFNCFLGL
ncbi:MAG: RNA methyltransferase [Candidatus Bathyarchaeia archaeon]